MVAAIFGIFGFLYQMVEHCLLQCPTPILMLLQSNLAGYKQFSYNLSQTHLFAQYYNIVCKISLNFRNGGIIYVFLYIITFILQQRRQPQLQQ